MIHQKPEIKVDLYTSTIKFGDIVKLVEHLKELEEQFNFETSISLYSKDGSTYTYRSAKQSLDNDIEKNINFHSKNTSIHGVSIRNFHDFYFNISSADGRMSLSKTTGSVIGSAFVEYAISVLKLRTHSLVGILKDRFWPVIALQIIATTMTIYYQLSYAYVFIFVLSLVIIFLSSYLCRGKIVMETIKDGFFVRKKDDVIIALAGLIIGYVLGFVTSFFSK